MRDLINFFFSFDKLFKEKLIIPFFWLSLIVFGLSFFAEALSAISLGPLAGVVKFINWFATLLWALVLIRLLSELAVALFRINDNLSPDGGRSELAEIDPVAEARKAAEAAAKRARAVAKTTGDKTRSTFHDIKDDMGDVTDAVTSKRKPVNRQTKTATTAKQTPKKTAAKKTTSKTKARKKAPATKKTAAKPKKQSTVKKPSRKKTTTVKPTASKARKRSTKKT